MYTPRLCIAVTLLLGTLSGCGRVGAADTAVGESVLIKDVPHVQQKPDFCGEACAEMFLRKLGHAITQDDVFNRAGLSPEKGRGCYTAELAPALRDIGFDVGKVWFKIPASDSEEALSDEWKAAVADLEKGVPSIVCMHYGEGKKSPEHFRLVLGYDAERREVIYHEPAVKHGAYRRMKLERFLRLWPLKYGKTHWLVVRLRLKPGRIVQRKQAEGFTDADYAQHILELKKKVPQGFTIKLERPFVVIGDEKPEMVRRRAAGTVKWAVDHLKASYFEKDPDKILDIWLFKDKASYMKHTRSIFKDRPSTPFGYYSHTHRALIMNIATGGGTLVHEIVHPFMASNFPECPAWFNEGMGSLYEQCGTKGGRIYGYTNWRLAGLQKAIKADKVPSFKELCSTSDYAFYQLDKGTNYAQARYLCYYLQEKGLLRKYYRDFLKNRKKDPSGYETLRAVLGEEDMDAFKKKWEKFVMGLRFP